MICDIQNTKNITFIIIIIESIVVFIENYVKYNINLVKSNIFNKIYNKIINSKLRYNNNDY